MPPPLPPRGSSGRSQAGSAGLLCCVAVLPLTALLGIVTGPAVVLVADAAHCARICGRCRTPGDRSHGGGQSRRLGRTTIVLPGPGGRAPKSPPRISEYCIQPQGGAGIGHAGRAMPNFRAFDRHRSVQRPPAGVAGVWAVVLAVAGTALAAGLYHETTDVPAARLDGHLRLPAAWHHQPLAMAAVPKRAEPRPAPPSPDPRVPAAADAECRPIPESAVPGASGTATAHDLGGQAE